MLKLQEIKVNKWLLFEEARLDLSEPGKYVIRGKNLDRSSKKNASNGSGKSMLASVIPNIRFGAPPTPLKVKRSAKDGFTKETTQDVILEDQFGSVHKIHRFLKGSIKIDFYKDDSLIKFRKSDDAKKHLPNLIPLNEEQYYTLVHLDTRKPSVFQYGTGPQRHLFIESLYNLDVYDRLSALVKKDLSRVSGAQQEQKLLKSQLAQKESELPRNIEKIRKKLKAADDKTVQAREKIKKIQAKIHSVQTYCSLSEDIQTKKSVDELNSELEEVGKHRKKLQRQKEAALEAEKQREAFEEVEQTRNNLKEKLKELADIEIDKTAQTRLREMQQRLESVEAEAQRQKEIESALKELHEKLNGLELSDSDKQKAVENSASKWTKALQRENGVIKELKNRLETTKEHLNANHDNCPVCSSALSGGFVRSYLKQQAREIEKAEQKYARIKVIAAYSSLHEELEELKRQKVDVEDSAALEKSIEELEDSLKLMRRKVLLSSKLKDLPRLENVEIIPYPDPETLKKAEGRERFLEKQITLITNRDKLNLEISSKKEAEKVLNKLEAEYLELQPELETAMETQNTLSNRLALVDVLTRDVVDLKQKIEDLNKDVEEAEIFSALRDAFGARGIRKQRVAEISGSIETSLNLHAPNFFDFPIRFELVVTDSDFQILSHRNGKVSDVRSLSGAESKCFSLLTMVSLLNLCSPNQRVDFVILDELEANLDQAFKERFMNHFIPQLLEFIPKVIIITPLSQEALYIADAVQYTVVKKDNVSKLVRN